MNSSAFTRLGWLRSKAAGLIALYIVLTLLSLLLFQQQGTDYLNTTLLKATASYGLARGLNGVVTVIQESSVSAGFVVEGTIAIGQILDPVNDLVERFSWVMVLSIVSLGIQKILMSIGVKAGFGLFLAALCVLSLGIWTRTAQKVGLRLLMLALLVQVAIPVTTAVGSVVSVFFIQEQYTEAEQAIEQAQQELQDALGHSGELDGKWYENIDPRKIIERVKSRTADITDHVVNLIVLFIFETVVLPLLTLWGLFQILKMLAAGRHSSMYT